MCIIMNCLGNLLLNILFDGISHLNSSVLRYVKHTLSVVSEPSNCPLAVFHIAELAG